MRGSSRRKAKGAFVSESALHSFDGDKPNSVGVIAHADDHSSHPSRTRDECPANFHSPWCDDTRGFYRAGCPSSVLSCTAWGFSCLANYSASGELLPRLFTLACLRSGKLSASPTSQRTGGVFSVTLSVNIRFRERCPRILRGMLPYGVRTFLQRAARGSPVIICHRRVDYHKNTNLEATKP
jgi:hypothetical protein